MNDTATSLNQFQKAISKEKINACLVQRGEEVILSYFRNPKMSSKLFQIHSVTKSVMSLLIGIAIERGQITSIHTPISTYLPNVPPEKNTITIEHLLTMTPGYEWPELTSWGGTPFPMIYSKDWIKFILEKGMERTPGEAMNYDSGASHLLSAILQKATGEQASAYARRELFAPLGIKEYRWPEDAKGITIGGFGLCLRAADMLKLGLLVLNKGVWGKQRLLSEEWLSASTRAYYHTYDHVGSYGYHWWILTDENNKAYEPAAFFAMGYGGQYILVAPERQLVIVMTSELFGNTFLPLRMVKSLLLPFLRDS
ncbi:6-aminohexanoate-dimer hydrolase [Brevibacillus reuszeri]|uniref:serine hydrolase domain-containing protein n=1 Tax=Brevibacillus reuszeri TaxID=54915 RepID=UPI001B1BF454|nr:serine hydrolase [Brevibacillus reuszeri]GIO08142.1 6-aminohexanoate-dimer hydrolase [Brevibacillus reuszeri]